MSLSLGFAQVWTRTREKASADLRESFGLLRQEKCQRKYSIVLARLHFEFYSRYEQPTRPISKARALDGRLVRLLVAEDQFDSWPIPLHRATRYRRGKKVLCVSR